MFLNRRTKRPVRCATNQNRHRHLSASLPDTDLVCEHLNLLMLQTAAWLRPSFAGGLSHSGSIKLEYLLDARARHRDRKSSQRFVSVCVCVYCMSCRGRIYMFVHVKACSHVLVHVRASCCVCVPTFVCVSSSTSMCKSMSSSVSMCMSVCMCLCLWSLFWFRLCVGMCGYVYVYV